MKKQVESFLFLSFNVSQVNCLMGPFLLSVPSTFRTQIGPGRFPIGSLCFFANFSSRNIPPAPESMRAFTGILRSMVFPAPTMVVGSKKDLFSVLATSTGWSGIVRTVADVDAGCRFKNPLLPSEKEGVFVLLWEGLDTWL